MVKFAFEMRRLKTNTLSVTLYLDKRREKQNGKFPLKLSIYSQQLNKKKLFRTKYEFTESEFSAVYDNSRVPIQYREKALEIKKLETDMSDLVKSIQPFSFERFEELQDIGIHDSQDIVVQMQLRYEDGLANNKYLNNWKTSKNSLLKYQEYRLNRTVESIKLSEIDSGWLHSYEKYMRNRKRSLATVGVYLRNLRTIFNKAINNGILTADLSPFGRGKYVIAAPERVNKALTMEELRAFIYLDNLTPLEELCRDYWMFSFHCNGMNLVDIAMLEEKDIKNNNLSFIRWKTKGTRRIKQSTIGVTLTDEAQLIIKKYHTNNSPFVLPIFDGLPTVGGDVSNWLKAHSNRKADFNKKLNNGLSSISQKLGFSFKITMYWARHSFATIMTRDGESVETISALLGHKDIKTTQGYLGRLDIKKQEQVSVRLSNLFKK
jgi:site-specific recombinase XerD